MMNNLLNSFKVLCSAMVLTVGISIPTSAESGENVSAIEFDYQAMAELLSDYLQPEVEIEEIVGEESCCNVKIYNENNDLVRFGKANNDLVINLINKSDFLLQVNGTKYYRLN